MKLSFSDVTSHFCTAECAEPEPRANAQLSPGQSSTNIEGDIRTFECLEGFSPAAGSDTGEITCQADSSWTSTNMLCLIGKEFPVVSSFEKSRTASGWFNHHVLRPIALEPFVSPNLSKISLCKI